MQHSVENKCTKCYSDWFTVIFGRILIKLRTVCHFFCIVQVSAVTFLHIQASITNIISSAKDCESLIFQLNRVFLYKYVSTCFTVAAIRV